MHLEIAGQSSFNNFFPAYGYESFYHAMQGVSFWNISFLGYKVIDMHFYLLELEINDSYKDAQKYRIISIICDLLLKVFYVL